jgi:iron complex outermembrane receptor protein
VAVSIDGVSPTVLSRADGGFTLNAVPSGSRTLRAERLGYAAFERVIEVPTSGELDVDVALLPTPIELGGVVVTATLDARAAAEALRPTATLTGRELDRRLGLTVAQTLATQAGVSAATMGAATARPVIRGFSGDRIMILEDGQQVADVSSTSPDHAVSTEGASADRLEVVRGPAALFYGSNALGGVVNVVREEVPRTATNRATGGLALEGGSVYRGGSASGDIVVPAGSLLLRGEGSYRRAGNSRTPLGQLENSGIETWNLSAGASRVGDFGYGGVAVRAFASDYGIPPDSVSGHAGGVDVELERLTVRGELEVERGLGALQHLNLTGAYTAYEHREIETSGAVGTAFNQSTGALELQGHHEEAGPFATGGFGIRVEGVDYFSDNGRDIVDTRELSAAVFGVEEWRQGAFSLQGGARYDLRWIELGNAITTVRGVDAGDRRFSALSASLAGLYELADGVRTGVSLARSVRTPSTDELFSQGPHLAAYAFEVGNPDLDPETGLGVDAFLRVTRPTFNAELVGFTTRIRDYSFVANTGEQRGSLFVYRFQNHDARFSGAEGSLEWIPWNGWTFGANASFVDAQNLETDEPLPLIPPLHGRVSARRERETWFVEATMDWADSQDRVPSRAEFPPNSPGYCDEDPGPFCRPVPGDVLPTDGYAKAGASIGYRWIRGNQVHSITLRGDNLANTTYRNHLSRLKELAPEPGVGVALLYRLVF